MSPRSRRNNREEKAEAPSGWQLPGKAYHDEDFLLSPDARSM